MPIHYALQLSKVKKQGWVYALFCESDAGIGYVKIGHSTNPFQRLSMLAQSCPFEAVYCGMARAGDARQAQRTEEKIHHALRHRRVNGEWFRFDFSSAEDKAEFQGICPKSKEGWGFFSYQDMREMHRIEAAKFYHTNKNKGPKGGAFISAHHAQNELRRYGT